MDTPRRKRVGPTVGLAAAIVVLALPAAASATTWAVTNTSDGPGPVCPSPASCTLRGAIAMANTGGGADVVTLAPGDYKLNLTAIPITKGMQIVGQGGAGVTKVEQLSTTVGILSIANTAADVAISGVTFTGADTSNGGAVSSQAPSLTLTNDVFSLNKPATAGGSGFGAVQVTGSAPTSLTVTGSTFSSNAAGGDGTATTSSGQGLGGGIFFSSPGSITVSGSTFTDNSAGGNGGVGVSSAQGSGGAIDVQPSTGIVNARISANTFTGNKAGGNGGAGTSSAQGSAAAFFFLSNATDGSVVTLDGNTFSANQAGGTPGAGASSGGGDGGAIEALGSGTFTLTNNTFSGNIAAGGGSGGTISTELSMTLLHDTVLGGTSSTGGNINQFGPGATVTLKNTVVAGGTATTGANCAGSITSAGHNIENVNTCSLTAAGDRPSVNPLLATLASNGGPTQTIAPLTGSPAIDGGDSSGCPATDQRGVLRPAGAACDVGAFEIATPASTTAAGSNVDGVTAVLNGSAFNPDLTPATAYFEYGTSTAYGKKTALQPVGATTRQAALSASVSGLRLATLYHYRLVVSNALGVALGPDKTFTTGSTVIQRLKLSHSKFAAAPGRGSSIARKKKTPVGATLSYQVGEKTVTTFTVQRRAHGYRSGTRCVSKRPKHHSGKLRRCTLYKSVGSFRHNDAAGTNSFHFSGRVKRKPLAVGRYRLRAVAHTVAGQNSKPTNTAFRIVK